jgi:predicted deacetylase
MLLVSILDVSPELAGGIDRPVSLVESRAGAGRFALLVVPHCSGEAPIAPDRAFQQRLRDWSANGIEMFVHGWSHRVPHPSGFAARNVTADEGEFSGLDRRRSSIFILCRAEPRS